MNLRSTLSIAALSVAVLAQSQLRVVSWNISNYSGGRIADIQTSVYGSFSGRSMSPDVILAQEIINATGMNDFLQALNTAPGSPGDWATMPTFINGADTDFAVYYRTSKASLIRTVIAATGSSASNDQPRNTLRHDLLPVGYTGDINTIAMYNSHMKASQDGTSVARRQVEASRIVANVATLPAGTQFLYCGDMNMSSSSQTPYQTMAGPTAPFVDPISSPGAWNSNPSAFRYILTQDPGPAQNMDSRFDFVLLGKSLYDGVGMDYVGSRTLPYSTSTWNDPNHSYRCWGNDGSTFSAPMNVATNSMVGPTIAQALRNCATSSGGHLPVFLDLKMPAKILIPTMTVDFGVLYRNAVAQRSITIQHAGDTAKWNVAGLQNLTYSMSAGSLITVSTGTKTLTPGAVTRQPIRVNTSNIGRFQQFVTVASNDTSNPTIQVLVKWSVRNDWEGPIGGGRDPRP